MTDQLANARDRLKNIGDKTDEIYRIAAHPAREDHVSHQLIEHISYIREEVCAALDELETLEGDDERRGYKMTIGEPSTDYYVLTPDDATLNDADGPFPPDVAGATAEMYDAFYRFTPKIVHRPNRPGRPATQINGGH